VTDNQPAKRCACWVPHEIRFQIEGSPIDPYYDVDASVLFNLPSGRQKRIPAFWSGGQTWCARFAPSSVGRHSYRVSVAGDQSTPHPEGQFEVVPYRGSNALFRHGPIRVHASRRYLCHQDGEPFFWLADTWWYGATGRCRWPEDFQFLVEDRAGKGFTAIQMVVGIPPEIAATDPEAANEGGPPFFGTWDRVNPDYFDYVDRRVACLVNSGLVPCIVGGWGHHIDWAGTRALTHFWEYLVARYAAYPVIWCLSGETDWFPGLGSSSLAGSVSALVPSRIRGSRVWAALRDRLVPAAQVGQPQSLRERRQRWEHVGQALSAADPSHHPLTTHPLPGGYAHETVNNAPWLDVTSIQSGHSEQVVNQMVTAILEARHLAPRRPIINMEPWYEGILGRFWGERQRYAFWMCVLAGAAGHTYGANGVWQMSTSSDDFLGHWGEADWRAAYAFVGSSQLGAARAFLEALPWWELEPCVDWITPHWGAKREDMPLTAAAGGDLVLVYFPATRRGFDAVLRNLEAGREYQSFWFDTRSGEILEARSFTAQETWAVPARPSLNDWLLVVRRA
jgi:hypothetical protein